MATEKKAKPATKKPLTPAVLKGAIEEEAIKQKCGALLKTLEESSQLSNDAEKIKTRKNADIIKLIVERIARDAREPMCNFLCELSKMGIILENVTKPTLKRYAFKYSKPVLLDIIQDTVAAVKQRLEQDTGVLTAKISPQSFELWDNSNNNWIDLKYTKKPGDNDSIQRADCENLLRFVQLVPRVATENVSDFLRRDCRYKMMMALDKLKKAGAEEYSNFLIRPITSFDTITDSLIALKNKNISLKVIKSVLTIAISNTIRNDRDFNNTAIEVLDLLNTVKNEEEVRQITALFETHHSQQSGLYSRLNCLRLYTGLKKGNLLTAENVSSITPTLANTQLPSRTFQGHHLTVTNKFTENVFNILNSMTSGKSIERMCFAIGYTEVEELTVEKLAIIKSFIIALETREQFINANIDASWFRLVELLYEGRVTEDELCSFIENESNRVIFPRHSFDKLTPECKSILSEIVKKSTHAAVLVELTNLPERYDPIHYDLNSLCRLGSVLIKEEPSTAIKIINEMKLDLHGAARKNFLSVLSQSSIEFLTKDFKIGTHLFAIRGLIALLATKSRLDVFPYFYSIIFNDAMPDKIDSRISSLRKIIQDKDFPDFLGADKRHTMLAILDSVDPVFMLKLPKRIEQGNIDAAHVDFIMKHRSPLDMYDAIETLKKDNLATPENLTALSTHLGNIRNLARLIVYKSRNLALFSDERITAYWDQSCNELYFPIKMIMLVNLKKANILSIENIAAIAALPIDKSGCTYAAIRVLFLSQFLTQDNFNKLLSPRNAVWFQDDDFVKIWEQLLDSQVRINQEWLSHLLSYSKEKLNIQERQECMQTLVDLAIKVGRELKAKQQRRAEISTHTARVNSGASASAERLQKKYVPQRWSIKSISVLPENADPEEQTIYVDENKRCYVFSCPNEPFIIKRTVEDLRFPSLEGVKEESKPTVIARFLHENRTTILTKVLGAQYVNSIEVEVNKTLTIALNELGQFIEHLDKKNPYNVVAKRGFDQTFSITYIDPLSHMDLLTLFSLLYMAIRDDTVRIGTKEDALNAFKKALAKNQREGNTNKDGTTVNVKDKNDARACGAGFFNGAVNALCSCFRGDLISIDGKSQELARNDFPNIVRRQFNFYFAGLVNQASSQDELQALDALLDKIDEQGITVIADKIKENIEQDLLKTYNGIYPAGKEDPAVKILFESIEDADVACSIKPCRKIIEDKKSQLTEKSTQNSLPSMPALMPQENRGSSNHKQKGSPNEGEQEPPEKRRKLGDVNDGQEKDDPVDTSDASLKTSSSPFPFFAQQSVAGENAVAANGTGQSNALNGNNEEAASLETNSASSKRARSPSLFSATDPAPQEPDYKKRRIEEPGNQL